MDKYNLKPRELISAPIWESFIASTKEGKKKLSIRAWRWISVISIHLFFFLSFFVDIQILEGTLNASRFLGFHLIDPFTTIEVFLAEHHIPVNLVIGTITIAVLYLLIGGRTYCGWICPYGLLSEFSECMHRTLVKKGLLKEKRYDHRIRYVFWILFLVLSLVTGLIVFETINVIGIMSRAIVYGWSIALLWVAMVFVFDVFFANRAWCTYICPVGTTYSMIGWASATRIEWNDNCDHCMACSGVCPEPHILELTKAKYEKPRKEKGISKEFILSGDCTLCGRCIDVCHTDALEYKFRLKNLL